MSVRQQYERYRGLIRTTGKAALHAIYPKEFEVYYTALELVDSKDRTVEYLIFPNNPNSIDDQRRKITNIKKSATGVTSISTTTFIPTEIILQGTFGKRMKLLTGQQFVDFEAFSLSEFDGANKLNFIQNKFNLQIKTGYGATKVLERILQKSSKIDPDGKPYYLILYNLSFGDSYMVKPVSFQFRQKVEDSNMIWNYNVQFSTLAPLGNIIRENKNSVVPKLVLQAVQSVATNQLNKALNVIGV